MDNNSGVGVIDKVDLLLGALEAGPLSLNDLAESTQIARPTAHRLATALEHHRMIARDDAGRFCLGPRLGELATAAGDDRLVAAATAVLTELMEATGESAQIYRRQGDQRICVAAVERPTGLRDTVPVGSALTMAAGSAAQALLAWDAGSLPSNAAFTRAELNEVKRRGLAISIGQREPGVASMSAPITRNGNVIAAVSISGPAERFGKNPERLFGSALKRAAEQLSD